MNFSYKIKIEFLMNLCKNIKCRVASLIVLTHLYHMANIATYIVHPKNYVPK